MLSLDASSNKRHAEFARLQGHRRRQHGGVRIVGLDGGDAVDLIADLQQRDVDVWPQPFTLESESGRRNRRCCRTG